MLFEKYSKFDKNKYFFVVSWQAVAAYLSPPIAVVYSLAISWRRMNEKVCLPVPAPLLD
jgi:hypothetical protein